MNRASLSVAATRRTRPRSLGAPGPAPCPGRVSLVMFPLAGRLPSTISAAPPWALFDSFTGTTRPSDFSRSFITGLRPQPSPHDPPLHHDRRVTVRSPGSQHEEITHMHGFSDLAGSETNASLRPHGTPTHSQGHRDSLNLRCRTLTFPSSCRLSGAFVDPGSGPVVADAAG